MSTLLELTPDEVLSTTRCVRRRLDLERPVERELIEECLGLAQQAPVASYQENWHFVVVTDPEKRAALGELWRKFGARYLGERPDPSVELPAGTTRLLDSVWFLMDHIGEVPVHVIPCIEGRTDGKPVPQQASRWGTIVPAAWSFMLAARTRGLGTCWTTFHLAHERGGCGTARHPVRRRHAGGAHPSCPHRGHGVPSSSPQAARRDRPLGRVVGGVGS